MASSEPPVGELLAQLATLSPEVNTIYLRTVDGQRYQRYQQGTILPPFEAPFVSMMPAVLISTQTPVFRALRQSIPSAYLEAHDRAPRLERVERMADVAGVVSWSQAVFVAEDDALVVGGRDLKGAAENLLHIRAVLDHAPPASALESMLPPVTVASASTGSPLACLNASFAPAFMNSPMLADWPAGFNREDRKSRGSPEPDFLAPSSSSGRSSDFTPSPLSSMMDFDGMLSTPFSTDLSVFHSPRIQEYGLLLDDDPVFGGYYPHIMRGSPEPADLGVVPPSCASPGADIAGGRAGTPEVHRSISPSHDSSSVSGGAALPFRAASIEAAEPPSPTPTPTPENACIGLEDAALAGSKWYDHIPQGATTRSSGATSSGPMPAPPRRPSRRAKPEASAPTGLTPLPGRMVTRARAKMPAAPCAPEPFFTASGRPMRALPARAARAALAPIPLPAVPRASSSRTTALPPASRVADLDDAEDDDDAGSEYMDCGEDDDDESGDFSAETTSPRGCQPAKPKGKRKAGRGAAPRPRSKKAKAQAGPERDCCSFKRCGSGPFARPGDVRRHEETCDENPHKRRLPCPGCKKTFSRRDAVQRHQRLAPCPGTKDGDQAPQDPEDDDAQERASEGEGWDEDDVV